MDRSPLPSGLKLNDNNPAKQMADRCHKHAQFAGRRAIAKGLDPSIAAEALIGVGLEMRFGLDSGRAAALVKHVLAYAYELMAQQLVGEAAALGAAQETLSDMRNTIQQTHSKMPARPMPQLVEAARERADLM